MYYLLFCQEIGNTSMRAAGEIRIFIDDIDKDKLLKEYANAFCTVEYFH